MRVNMKCPGNSIISQKAVIGDGVSFGYNCIVEEDVVIGDNVYIDSNTILRSGTEIGKDSFVGSNCILGEYQMDFIVERTRQEHKLIIGEASVIRSGSILYTGSEIGHHFQTGHRVTVREDSRIGNFVSLGTLDDVQGKCFIGDYVRAHSNVHIAQYSRIESFVWLFPYVLLTNDPNPPSEDVAGIHIKSFAAVASGAVILPGKEIGQDSLVAAGSVVTQDVGDYTIVMGNPAKKISDVRKLNLLAGKEIYPWRDNFKRGMPWVESDFSNWFNSIPEAEKERLNIKDLKF